MKKIIPVASFVVLGSMFLAMGLFFFEKPVLAGTNETQDELDKTEKKLKKELADLKALQQSLGQITFSLTSTQQLIQRTQTSLNQTAQTINQKELEISNLEKQLNLEKKVLGNLLQEMYISGEVPFMEVVLTTADLTDFFQEYDNLFSTQEEMQGVIEEINDMKAKVSEEKLSLEDTKKDHEELLEIKNKQKQVLVANKINVEEDVADQKVTVAELEGKLSELRGALSGFLGKSYSTKDIDDAVKFASKATGVRKEFLQAELIVETGYGSFTGGCTYKNIRMKEADKKQFLVIAAELEKAYGGNYKNKKLSCSPNFGYGGAMGVAQFMPTTWIGYKTQISKKTGSTPADPWDLADGVTGMAIKLANGGATSKKGEFLASKRYYCGGPGSPYWNNKCNDYAKKVQNYSKDPESHF